MGCSGSTTCGMSDPKSFDAIDGTPIKYGRPGDYTRITVRAERSFYDRMVLWIRSLRSFSSTYGGSSFETLKWLGHAGAYVCKNGCHGRGRAFDLNRVRWNGYTVDIYGGDHASGTRSVRRRYLAVDATCRRYFKYTLDGWYNSAHANHIHFDDHTQTVLSKSSRSDTVFVQAVCNNFNGAGLVIDGDWGPLTQGAFNDINREMNYKNKDPFTKAADYRVWLGLIQRHGFKNVSAGYYTCQSC